MFCRGIEQNDTPVMRIVGHLHVASDRFPSEWSLALIGNASGRTGGKGGRLGPRRFR
jgi:hypothetical protein